MHATVAQDVCHKKIGVHRLNMDPKAVSAVGAGDGSKESGKYLTDVLELFHTTLNPSSGTQCIRVHGNCERLSPLVSSLAPASFLPA